MITVVARVIRDEFSGKEGAKVWSVKSINRPYKEVESCDKRRRRQRMDLTRSQCNALFFERVNNSSSIFPSRHVHVYIFWKIEDWKCDLAHPGWGGIRIFYLKMLIVKNIYISVWKKGLKNKRGKDLDWREEQSKGENLLGNFHSSGRKICWEKSDECLRLFHREADFLLGTTDVERGWRSFDQKEKSKRKEAEEETSVETKRSLLSSHSWRGSL